MEIQNILNDNLALSSEMSFKLTAELEEEIMLHTQLENNKDNALDATSSREIMQRSARIKDVSTDKIDHNNDD